MMKMKKFVALILAIVLCLSLVACGGPDKQPAIDAFNAAVDRTFEKHRNRLVQVLRLE